MEVLFHPTESLRQQSVDIVYFDNFLKLFVDQMIDTMYTYGGVGLAAPQVGVNRRIIIVDPSAGDDAKELRVMINPKIIASSGEVFGEEGCLSLPGRRGEVKRNETVTVEFFNIDGTKQLLFASGFLAVIIQHEIDHLSGILFIDRALRITTSQRRALEKTA
jgi:peptide deformylase